MVYMLLPSLLCLSNCFIFNKYVLSSTTIWQIKYNLGNRILKII